MTDGCDLHPVCTECPKERCRYDGGSRDKSRSNGKGDGKGDGKGIELRNIEIRQTHAGGSYSVAEIAKLFGLTRQHVYRVLKEG